MVVMVRGRCKEGEEQEQGPTVLWDIMDTRWVHATYRIAEVTFNAQPAGFTRGASFLT